MQNEDQNKLYTILKKPIPSTVMASKNRAKTWEYGYHKKYDLVVISKNGTLGDVYEINGVKVGLPKMPKKVDWTKLAEYEQEDNTIGNQTLACTADACEIVDIVN